MRFDSSISMSELVSSGKGIATAVRRSLPAGSASSRAADKYSDWRAKEAEGSSRSEEHSETGVGSVSLVGGDDGEDGSAVCIARRSTVPVPRGGEENGAGTTRGPGYDAELLESPEEVRECGEIIVFPDTVLVREELVTILERGRAGGEPGAARPETLPVDREGERDRCCGDMVRAAEVA
jgi:hypothetical protein